MFCSVSMIGIISRNVARATSWQSSVLRVGFSSSSNANTRVFAWGEGASGQLGNGQTQSDKMAALSKTQSYTETLPIEITQLKPNNPNEEIVQLAAGADSSGALTAGGQVWLWGNNTRVSCVHILDCILSDVHDLLADIAHNIPDMFRVLLLRSRTTCNT